MSADPNKKSARTFQCRDVLWETFEQMARELECSIDYLINESMKQYARQRSYRPSTPFPGMAREGGQMPTGQGPAQNATPPPMPAQGFNPGAPQMPMGGPPPPPPVYPGGPGGPPQPPPMMGPTAGMAQPGQGYGPPPQPFNNTPPGMRPGVGGPPPPPPPGPGPQAQQQAQQQPKRPPSLPAPPAPATGRPAAGPPPPPASMGPRMPPPGPTASPGSQMRPGQPMGGTGRSVPPPPPPPGPIGGGYGPPPMGGQPMQQPPPPPPPAYGAMPPMGAGMQPGQPTLAAFYAGQRYVVNKDRFIIGRGKQSSDLTIKDPNVSRQHAMVEFLNGQYYMVDMGSTNGVEYNGQRIARKAIAEGDLFRICDHEVRFSYR